MTDQEALETIEMMVDMGVAANRDDAVHMLADMGDIDSTQHAELLSDTERQRIYGD